MKKTIVYVDGFNLYYGALKGTNYKWLDILKLCQSLLPKNQITKIKYFTAQISARPNDPDKPTRQQTYLRALRTIPDLEIIPGTFLTCTCNMPLANCPPGKQQFATVIKTEEKGSDVNIATHLLIDGFRNAYEAAVLITNDSDLLEPIKFVRYELNLPVGQMNPHKNPSYALQKHVSFYREIRRGLLSTCQFSDPLTDNNGHFRKPPSW